ncbi:unnamed protein product [Rodentolepis nana]|uniref:Tetraspanin n=1 Tax=Rodentolepis nana TaxID=102285 RepID=A0A0R3TBB7_RODNA|nr:unnamed protein product [Rodentolepis nana]
MFFMGSKVSEVASNVFAVFVGITIIAQVFGAVLLIALKNKVKFVNNYFLDVMQEFQLTDKKEQAEIIMKLQAALNCCGISAPSDWPDPTMSCCMPGEQTPCNDYPQQGCDNALYAWLDYGMLSAGVTILIFSLIDVGAIVAAACLVERKVHT